MSTGKEVYVLIVKWYLLPADNVGVFGSYDLAMEGRKKHMLSEALKESDYNIESFVLNAI